MSLFRRYNSKVRRRLDKRIRVGAPLLLYIPISIDQTEFMSILGYKVIDASSIITRYPSRFLHRLIDRINHLLNKGYQVISNLEYIYHLYPRERYVYNDLLSTLDGPVIITFSIKNLYDSAIKNMKYDSLSLSEAGIDDLSSGLYDESIYLSEGSPTFPNTYKNYIDSVMKKILLIRDSNERYLLYYLTRHRGVGRLARVMGSELGTYINRLVKRGFIHGAGTRRGIYIVRDPLIRYYIYRTYMPTDPPYKYIGFLYLIRKFFEGIKGRASIPISTGDLYIGEPRKFYYIDRNTFILSDIDSVHYIIRLSSGDRSDFKIMDKYPRMEKVLITSSNISIRSIRSFERIGINVLRVRDINSFTRYTNFPRLI